MVEPLDALEALGRANRRERETLLPAQPVGLVNGPAQGCGQCRWRG